MCVSATTVSKAKKGWLAVQSKSAYEACPTLRVAADGKLCNDGLVMGQRTLQAPLLQHTKHEGNSWTLMQCACV